MAELTKHQAQNLSWFVLSRLKHLLRAKELQRKEVLGIVTADAQCFRWKGSKGQEIGSRTGTRLSPWRRKHCWCHQLVEGRWRTFWDSNTRGVVSAMCYLCYNLVTVPRVMGYHSRTDHGPSLRVFPTANNTNVGTPSPQNPNPRCWEWAETFVIFPSWRDYAQTSSDFWVSPSKWQLLMMIVAQSLQTSEHSIFSFKYRPHSRHNYRYASYRPSFATLYVSFSEKSLSILWQNQDPNLDHLSTTRNEKRRRKHDSSSLWIIMCLHGFVPNSLKKSEFFFGRHFGRFKPPESLRNCFKTILLDEEMRF